MDKRVAKRHKRQVLRGRERIQLSEPDLRTSEQIKAAREASRPQERSSRFIRQGPFQSPKLEEAS